MAVALKQKRKNAQKSVFFYEKNIFKKMIPSNIFYPKQEEICLIPQPKRQPRPAAPNPD